MRKYEYKMCKCGNEFRLERLEDGLCLDGDTFTNYHCKDCGAEIRVYHKEKKPESTWYIHDGGWYND